MAASESTLKEGNLGLTEGAEQSLDKLLSRHSDRTAKSPRLSENDVKHISSLLQYMGKPSWAKAPRLYVVLRLVKHVQVIDSFLAQGVSDIWFPFSHKTLPETLRSATARHEFIQLQDLVLTKAFDLEREDGKHRHFSRPDDIPLQKLGELGKGGFGYVDRVLSTITYREYARKLIPKGKTFKKNRNVLLDFERELGNLKKLAHIHIVEFVGSYTDVKFVGILMSPVADYNLKDFLARSPLSSGDLSFLRTFFGCLAQAVCYLHDQQIRHKDIKPQNVLVKNERVYLTDFGISLDWSELDDGVTSGATVKTLRYAAPEVAQQRPRDSSSDMWSLGCVYLEMWTVMKGESVRELTRYLQANGARSPNYFQNGQSAEAWCEALMEKGNDYEENVPASWICDLLQYGPDERWTAHVLIQRIQEANENPELRYTFSGTCCIGADDSTVSDISSRTSSVLLDETGASSVEVYDPHLSVEWLQRKTSSTSNLSAQSADQSSTELDLQQQPMPMHQVSYNDIVRTDTALSSAEEEPAETNHGSQTAGRVSKTPLLIKRKPLARLTPANSSHTNLPYDEQKPSLFDSPATTSQEGVIYGLDASVSRTRSRSKREGTVFELEGSFPYAGGSQRRDHGFRYQRTETPPRAVPFEDEHQHNVSPSEATMANMPVTGPMPLINVTIIEPSSDKVLSASNTTVTKPEDLAIKPFDTSPNEARSHASDTETHRSPSLPSQRAPQGITHTFGSFLLSAGRLHGRSRSTSSVRNLEGNSLQTDTNIAQRMRTSEFRKSDSNLSGNLNQSMAEPAASSVTDNGSQSTSIVDELKRLDSVTKDLDLSIRSPSQSSFQLPAETSASGKMTVPSKNRTHDTANLVKWVESISEEHQAIKYKQFQGRAWREKLRAEKCSSCRGTLHGNCLQALDGRYHEQCFECTDCGIRFGSTRQFFPVLDTASGITKPFCFSCLILRYYCISCSLPIDSGHAMVSDRRYHQHCLKCTSGSCRLEKGDSWFEYNGQIFCFYHYTNKSSPLCEGCQRSILDQFQLMEGGTWHLECYKVHGILQGLENRQTAVLGDLISGPVLAREHLVQFTCEMEWSPNNSASWNALAAINSYADIGPSLVSRLVLPTTYEARDEWILAQWDLLSYIEVLFDVLDILKGKVDRCEPTQDISYNETAASLYERVVFLTTLSVKCLGAGSDQTTKSETSIARIDITQHLTSLCRIALASILNMGEAKIKEATRVFFDKRVDLDQIWARHLEDIPGLKLRAVADSSETPERCVACMAPIADEHIVMSNWKTARWHLEHFMCDRCDVNLEWDLEFARYDERRDCVFCDQHAPETAESFHFAQVGCGALLSKLLRVAFAKAILAIEADGVKRS